MKRTAKIFVWILSAVTLLAVMCIPAFASDYRVLVVINYADEAGNNIAQTFATHINVADTNKPTWSSPEIIGYELKDESDAVVTYDMLDKSYDNIQGGLATYTVVYARLYSHSIKYVDGTTDKTIGRYTANGRAGQEYTITAPDVIGMTPTKSTITGKFESSHTFEIVYYYPNVYTITYDANSGAGAPPAQTKVHGQPLTLTSYGAVRHGYNQIGWSKSPDAMSVDYKAGASFEEDSDTTLYAVWKPIEYTITFDANGGTFPIESVTVHYGGSFKVPLTEPKRDGYVFLGWSVSSNSTVSIYNLGMSYPCHETKSKTIYAVWEKESEENIVSYNANGGTGAPEPVVKRKNVALILSPVYPTREGYAFMGWATSPTSSTVSYAAGGWYYEDNPITLYAVWSPVTYTVIYDAKGGSNAPSAQTKTHDTALTLRSEVPYRDQYKFLGWSRIKSAKTPTYYPGGTYRGGTDI